MILLTIALIILGIIAAVTLIPLLAGGAAFLVVFGDLIVAVGIITFIVKLFRK